MDFSGDQLFNLFCQDVGLKGHPYRHYQDPDIERKADYVRQMMASICHDAIELINKINPDLKARRVKTCNKRTNLSQNGLFIKMNSYHAILVTGGQVGDYVSLANQLDLPFIELINETGKNIIRAGHIYVKGEGEFHVWAKKVEYWNFRNSLTLYRPCELIILSRPIESIINPEFIVKLVYSGVGHRKWPYKHIPMMSENYFIEGMTEISPFTWIRPDIIHDYKAAIRAELDRQPATVKSARKV